jgi:hypothetical protein
MRKRFGMLVLTAAVGLSLLAPDNALARRYGRRRGYRSAANCSTCATVTNCGACGSGCGTGAPVAAPGMSGPPPAPGAEAPPAPTPAPSA